ncbi:MAG TPA: endonuclease/exonuclease/phosphatase family protein [Rhodothermales bacterium]|nr:endonuclease/exonuclease/phosphatase family protein [Rhodothermales bacterium]
MARFARLLAGGVMRLVETCMLGAFLLGYLARYVRPGGLSWPLQALGPLLPYLAMAVLVLAVPRLWRSSPRRRLAYAVALALAAVRFLPEVWVRPAPSGADLLVVTYNVPRWAGPDVAQKEAEIVRYAAMERPHVLAFQEPTVYYSAREERVVVAPFLRRLRDTLGYRVGRTAFAPTRRSPQPIFTRGVRVVTAEELSLRRDTANAPTYVSRIVFRYAGREAVLYNVHLYTHGARKPWRDEAFRRKEPRTWLPFIWQFRDAQRYRAWEADSLRKLIDAESRPVLVVGDFNATPHEWSFAHLARAQGGLYDGFREAGRAWGATFHRRYPVVRIDHILASRDFRIVRARVPDIAASDHRPVEVRLRWR